MTSPLNIVSYTLSSAAGVGLQALAQTIVKRSAVLKPCDYANAELDTWIGEVAGVQDHSLPETLSEFDSRNNRLLDYALQQDGFIQNVSRLQEKIRPNRMAVVMGSSTASMSATEQAYGLSSSAELKNAAQRTAIHTPHAPGRYVARRLGIQGPVVTISTACSSSAKSFAMASRWLQANLVDAVVVGGADSISLGTLYGFASLNLLSKNPCRPFDKHRDGISVGEAAGFALLTRADDAQTIRSSELCLMGYGESSDAHHMSHPHPEALGAVTAMNQAIAVSQCSANDIGYVNLHGTATPTNDLIESQALNSVFPEPTMVSSTKGWTGHTLGAAGITGAVIALEALRTELIPGTVNMAVPDDELTFGILSENQQANISHAMVNSFGFGGSNCSLVFGRMN